MPPSPNAPRTVRRRATTLVVVIATVVGAALAPPSLAATIGPTATGASSGPATPSPDIEAQFVSRINGLRASRGLSQLAVHSQLLSVARNWTERMVQAGRISHNPNLSSEVSGDWTKLGENVGVGPTVDDLMNAFMASPAHYRNLVDPEWNYVAVGVVRAADGQLYTTHNFMVMGGSPPPPPPPTTQPPATTPTTPPAPSGPSATTPTEAPTTTTAPPAGPHPSAARVTAVLDPLRSLERG